MISFKRIAAAFTASAVLLSQVMLLSPYQKAFAAIDTSNDYDWQSLPDYEPGDNLAWFDVPEVSEITNSDVTGATVEKAEFDNSYPEADNSYANMPSSFGENFDPDATEYYITSIEDLREFRDRVNGDYIKNDGTTEVANNFVDKTIILTSDIDLSDDEWMPIGKCVDSRADKYDIAQLNGLLNNKRVPYPNAFTKFNGKFEGLNHKIYNLTINNISLDFAGFFGLLGDSASINDLHIIDANIVGRDFVGSVVGYIDKADLTNCSASGQITGNFFVGGIFGGQAHTSNNDYIKEDFVIEDNVSHILNCTIHESSTGKTLTVKGTYSVGGIAGYAAQINISYENNTAVKADVEGMTAIGGVVGIVGPNNILYDKNRQAPSNKLTGIDLYFYMSFTWKIENITILGSVEYINNIVFDIDTDYIDYIIPGYYVGGVVGCAESYFQDSYNSASSFGPAAWEDLSAIGDFRYDFVQDFNNLYLANTVHGKSYVGHLGGYVRGDLDNISVSSMLLTTDPNGDIVGSIAGWFRGNYDTSVRNITVRDDINVSAKSYVGGLFGFADSEFQFVYYCRPTQNPTYLTIYRLTFDNINLPDNICVNGEDYVGGLVGWSQGLYGLSNAFKTNSINVTVNGNNYVGGISGYAVSPSMPYGDDMPNIQYEFDSITVNGNVSGHEYVGGLFGYYAGRIAPQSLATVNYSLSNTSTIRKVGGIIVNCVNNAVVSGTSNVGGIAGTVTTAHNAIPGNQTSYINAIEHELYWPSDMDTVGYFSYSDYFGYTYKKYKDHKLSFDTRMYISSCINNGVISATTNNIGGIAGSNYLAVITNCYNTANINAPTANRVGGIIGFVDSSNYYYKKKFGYTPGTVYNHTIDLGSSWSITPGGYYSLDGEMYSTTNIAEYALDKYSYPVQITTTPAKIISDGAYCTRLLAIPEITYCRNDGTIQANNNVGGITGELNDYIGVDSSSSAINYYRYLINNGEISGDTSVGGIFGYMTGRAGLTLARNLQNITGSNNVGGIIGLMDQCTALGNSFNIGQISGNVCVGGLVGLAESGDVENMLDVVYNAQLSEVKNNETTRKLNARAKLTISTSYNTGCVDGDSFIGGIAGRVNMDKTHTIDSRIIDSNYKVTWGTGSISSTYTVGEMPNIDKATTINYFFGETVGNITSITGCYIDENITQDINQLGYFTDVCQDPFNSQYPIISNYEFAVVYSNKPATYISGTWCNTIKHQTEYGTLASNRPLLSANLEAGANDLHPLPLTTDVVDYNSWRDFLLSYYTGYSDYGRTYYNPHSSGSSNYNYRASIVNDPSIGVVTTLNWTPYEDNVNIKRDEKLRQMGGVSVISHSSGYAGTLNGNNNTIAFAASQKEDEVERFLEDVTKGGQYTSVTNYDENKSLYINTAYIQDEDGNYLDSDGNITTNYKNMAYKPGWNTWIPKDHRYMFSSLASKGVVHDLVFIDGSPLSCNAGDITSGVSGGTSYGLLENITVYNRGLAGANEGVIKNCKVVSPSNYTYNDMRGILNSTYNDSYYGNRTYNSSCGHLNIDSRMSSSSRNYGCNSYQCMLQGASFSNTNNGIITNCVVENGSVFSNNSSTMSYSDKDTKGIIKNTYTLNAPLIYGFFKSGTIENCYAINALYFIGAISMDGYDEFDGQVSNCFLYNTDDFDEILNESIANKMTLNCAENFVTTPQFIGKYMPATTFNQNKYDWLRYASAGYCEKPGDPIGESTGTVFGYWVEDVNKLTEGKVLNCFINGEQVNQTTITSLYPKYTNIVEGAPVYVQWHQEGLQDVETYSVDTVTNDMFADGSIAYRLYMWNKEVLGTPDEENFWGQFIAEDSNLSKPSTKQDPHPVLNLDGVAAWDDEIHPRVYKVVFNWTDTATENAILFDEVEITEEVEEVVKETDSEDIDEEITETVEETTEIVEETESDITLDTNDEQTSETVDETTLDDTSDENTSEENTSNEEDLDTDLSSDTSEDSNTSEDISEDDEVEDLEENDSETIITSEVSIIALSALEETPEEENKISPISFSHSANPTKPLIWYLTEDTDTTRTSYVTEGSRIIPPSESDIGLEDSDTLLWVNAFDNNSLFNKSTEIVSDSLIIPSSMKVILFNYEALENIATVIQPDGENNGIIKLWVDIKNKVDEFTPTNIGYKGDSVNPAETQLIVLTDGEIITYIVTGTDEADETIQKLYDLDLHWLGLTHYDIPYSADPDEEPEYFEGEIDNENNKIRVHIPRSKKPKKPTTPNTSGDGIITPDVVDPDDEETPKVLVTNPDDPEMKKEYEVIIVYDDEPLDLEITKYEILGHEGVINQTENTITIKLKKSEYSGPVAPDVLVYVADEIIPGMNSAVDLEDNIIYTLEDITTGNTRDYTLIIEWEDDSKNLELISYKLLGYEGQIEDIDETAGTIIVVIPKSKKPEAGQRVIPDNIEYIADSITPDVDTAIDLDENITYVLREDTTNKTKSYDLVIIWEDDSKPKDLKITEYKLLGEDGTIDNDSGTITLNILKSKKPKDGDKVKPDVLKYIADSITPNEKDFIDLNEKVIYVLTDEETGNTKSYELIINWIDDETPNNPNNPNKPSEPSTPNEPYVPNVPYDKPNKKPDEKPDDTNPNTGVISNVTGLIIVSIATIVIARKKRKK